MTTACSHVSVPGGLIGAVWCEVGLIVVGCRENARRGIGDWSIDSDFRKCSHKERKREDRNKVRGIKRYRLSVIK